MADSSSSPPSDEDQRHQAKAQMKGRTPPLNKKPAAGEQQPAASPSSLRKKPAASKKRQKVKSAAPAPIPAPTPAAAAAADDDVSGSIKVASHPPPEDNPLHSAKPDQPTSAAASRQMRSEKKRTQQQAGASAQEGEAAGAGGPSSKKPFQRVWAEDDEIALLEAMVSHSPVSDITVAVGGKFSKKQIFEKVRKLKKKYMKYLHWGEKGVGSSFVNSHDQHVFELSKKLWPTMEGDSHGHVGDDDGIRINDEGKKIGGLRLEQTYPTLENALHMLEEDGDNLLASSASRTLDTRKLKVLESQWDKHFKEGVKYCLEQARMKADLLELIAKVL